MTAKAKNGEQRKERVRMCPRCGRVPVVEAICKRCERMRNARRWKQQLELAETTPLERLRVQVFAALEQAEREGVPLLAALAEVRGVAQADKLEHWGR